MNTFPWLQLPVKTTRAEYQCSPFVEPQWNDFHIIYSLKDRVIFPPFHFHCSRNNALTRYRLTNYVCSASLEWKSSNISLAVSSLWVHRKKKNTSAIMSRSDIKRAIKMCSTDHIFSTSETRITPNCCNLSRVPL